MDRAPFKNIAGPYPGLRPFRREEAPIFFGREEHIDALLERLEGQRFVAVVGASGAGKSSLVKAGLIPALQAGLLAQAGGKWLVAEMRPGEHPVAGLAHAVTEALSRELDDQGRIGFGEFVTSELERGRFGLRNVVQAARPAPHSNLLVIADQFEEIFRYHKEGDAGHADAFVNLLLESSRQTEVPVYVVITMRSDFVGDCAQFDGLPEAISASQYLTPRLTREQLSDAITKPALMFDGEIEPALVNDLINQLGRDQDQLPLLQHALMRMWLHARRRTLASESTVVTAGKDYVEVGGVEGALSNHADSIYLSLGAEQKRLAALMFRRLTDAGSGKSDTRSPAAIAEIAASIGCEWQQLIPIVEAFRAPGCHFLMADSEVLTPQTNLDISHESFIRHWYRFHDNWVTGEQQAADNYRELTRRSLNFKNRRGSELSELDLRRLGDWWADQRPTMQWARRYATNAEKPAEEFAEVEAFLATSQGAVDAERRERQREAQLSELQRQRELETARELARVARAHAEAQEGARRRLLILVAVLFLLLGSAIYFWIQASRERQRAETERGMPRDRQR